MTEDAKILHYDFRKNSSTSNPPLDIDDSIVADNVINLANFRKEKFAAVSPAPALDSDWEAKLAHFQALIQRGKLTTVVDSRQAGVLVPEHLQNNKALNIDWSYKFNLHDFAFDKNGVRGSLTFAGQLFFTYLPWKSIWIIFRAEEGMTSAVSWPIEKEPPKNS